MPELDADADADAVVVGAGIVGACCALELARRGLSVLVAERGAVVAGTTGAGEGNILVSDKVPGPELDLALLADRLWRQLGDEFDRDVELEAKGGVVVSRTEAGTAALFALAAAQADAGVIANRLDRAALADSEPHLADDVLAGVSYPQDQQVQPMLAAAAILRCARALGARVRPHTEVVGVERSGEGAVRAVHTSAGSVRTRLVVNAAGPWAGDVAALAGGFVPISPRRGFILVTAPAPALVRHKVYDADYVTDVAASSASLQSSAVVEGTRSGTVLIGATREIVGFDRSWDIAALRRLARQAVSLFPVLAGLPVIRVYRGFRPYSPDHLPVIGPDPRVSGLVHACGHEGAGIGLAPATGRLVAQLVAGERPDLPLGSFAPDRFCRAAS